ncbi:hypothetical protein PRNP1_013097 [Phytophthora ramorum]
MAAGCSGCLGPVKICMVKYEMFGHDAIMSATTFKDFAERKADESLYDFSVLPPDNLAVGPQLDPNGATCQSGVNEFGAMTIAVASSAGDILALVKSMNLSIAPQMIREIEIAVEGNAPCESGWNIHGVSRLYILRNMASRNGRLQVVYLAQITYHLIYNSDLYMIGLETGTLTIESVVNLTCCFFAFSYAS